ncbi:hypothetical protein IAQ61_006623 [Plenodomus lingam]|uniref:BRCT domain-containing protein n=1 Tax=Leptosphaeria maculans (strain JN3 / isolate v23.1.3 / race Av1-4-5-6-7-8) TaxID=985895 RepID=E5AFP4_LEPMJ|nr:hypothetical protein LEMA_P008200.1 [Plenodomus lingam JN3]KAH9869417.1 hypothetical protein IAQ61_006623 [Plenodomus lingam]CBY02033.1 hypothetical protein LEMA_P008200.1 [Plenodomus lingam JN3]
MRKASHLDGLLQESSYDMRDAGRRSHPPASSDDPSLSTPCATINTSRPRSKPHQTAVDIAAPARRTFFDPWNSSSTGHQRAENRLSGSTSWRVSRNLKLGEQYRAGLDGGKRVTDTVGAGSADFGNNGRKENGTWEHGAKGLRPRGQKSLVEAWGASKASKAKCHEKDIASVKVQDPKSAQTDRRQDHFQDSDLDLQSCRGELPAQPAEKQLFTGLCFYVNGSTAPLVSDHKLKQSLALYGARHSIALGRRTVTHVILGTSNTRGGAGGGLAATKMQKEIARTGGKAVKFITAEWVIESIKAGRRLPESRFSPLKLASQSQNSVLEMQETKKAGQG